MNSLNEIIKQLENDLGIVPNSPILSKENFENKSVETADKGKRKESKQKKKDNAESKKDSTNDLESQPEITKLDIRVGEIVKVWKHETADKLYCEEIDVGEEAPRNIASGLVPHYSLEEMQGRKVLVLCNLKARNLVGFKSHGMVLCAAKKKSDGGEKVAFVEPPVDAPNGERVVFEGLVGEPISAAQVEKKMVLSLAGSNMKTDGEGVAMWKDFVFQTSAGPCKAVEVPFGNIR